MSWKALMIIIVLLLSSTLSSFPIVIIIKCLAQTAAMQIGQHRKEQNTNAYNTMLTIQL